MQTAINTAFGPGIGTVSISGGRITVTSASTGIVSMVLLAEANSQNSLITLLTNKHSAVQGTAETSGSQTYNSVADPTASSAKTYGFTITVDGDVCTGDDAGYLYVTLPANATFAQIATAMEDAINADFNNDRVSVIKNGGKVKIISNETGSDSTVLLDGITIGSLITLFTSVETAVAGVDVLSGMLQ